MDRGKGIKSSCAVVKSVGIESNSERDYRTVAFLVCGRKTVKEAPLVSFGSEGIEWWTTKER